MKTIAAPHQFGKKGGCHGEGVGQARGTFLATMKSGHVGVYARDKGAPVYRQMMSPTTGRMYYGNSHQLWGPSIAKEIGKEPISELFRKTVETAFQTRLDHELNRLMSSIDPSRKGLSPTAAP